MHCAQNDEHSPLTAVNSVETSTNNATIPPVLSVIINGRRNKKPLGLLSGPTDLRPTLRLFTSATIRIRVVLALLANVGLAQARPNNSASNLLVQVSGLKRVNFQYF